MCGAHEKLRIVSASYDKPRSVSIMFILPSRPFIAPAAGSDPRAGAYDPQNPADKPKLASDAVFMAAVDAALSSPSNQLLTTADRSRIMDALLNGNLASLSVDERASIIDTIRGHIPRDDLRMLIHTGNHVDVPATVLAVIAKYSNNQGYSGPGAGQVVATIPKAGGGDLAITQGELMDDEGFGSLVDRTYLAAGGQPGMFNMGMPGGTFGAGFGSSRQDGMTPDMSKWSKEERISYLKLVADLGRDGNLSNDDHLKLMLAIQERNNGGGEEPSVTLPSGKKVSNDDLMEDGTFQKLLSDRVHAFGAGAARSGPIKDLIDLIATADYSQLSLKERTDLLTALDAATKSWGGSIFSTLTNDQASAITQMFRGFLAPDPAAPASAGQTLSNGLVVGSTSLANPDDFGSLVQQTLQRSGLLNQSGAPLGSPLGTTAPHSDEQNRRAASTLMAIDASRLTPAERLKLLEKIATAARDGVIDDKELRDIMSTPGVSLGMGMNAFI
jgi:hypothetical protein